MESDNSKDDSELQPLLDFLEDGDPGWLSTNEFSDFLANLQALDALIWATSKSPTLWKWVIIAAHATLQSLAVCKLTGTDGFGAKTEEIEKKILAFYADGKNTLENNEEFLALTEKENMANFPTLMRRMGYDVPKANDVSKKTDNANLALYFLHDFRSTYCHYPPVQFTLHASTVHKIVRIAVQIIDVEIKKCDWRRVPLITLDEVGPVLDSIQRRFDELGKY